MSWLQNCARPCWTNAILMRCFPLFWMAGWLNVDEVGGWGWWGYEFMWILSRLSFVLFFFFCFGVGWGGDGGVVWVSFYLSSGALIFILGNVFGSFMTWSGHLGVGLADLVIPAVWSLTCQTATSAMPEKRKHEDIRMLDLVIATRENTAKLGYFVDDTVVNPGLGIPYYKTATCLNTDCVTESSEACQSTLHWGTPIHP